MRWKELVLEGAQVSKTALGVRGLLALLLSAFGIFDLWSGYAVVLLADLSGALDLSPGPLSIALLIGTVASLAAMPALGWTADRRSRPSTPAPTSSSTPSASQRSSTLP